MIIDANMYWFPEEVFTNQNLMQKFLTGIPETSGIYGYETINEKNQLKQIVIEKPKGSQNLNYAQGDYLLEKQLADMDQAGIDKAVLKLPGCQEWLPLELCKQFNDGMAKHAKHSNGRMTALAVLPPWGTPECIHELERCRYELGMRGVQLSTHYGSLYLDDPSFAPFFQKLNEIETSVYVHHSPLPVQYDSLIDYNNLRRQYGRCVDQATAVGRELFSGFFDKYPRLKTIHSMLGGGFFTYMNMLMPHTPKTDDKVGRFDAAGDSLRRQLEHNLFFEMSQAQSWGKAQLECAVAVMGADHILFGSSYPVRREWLIEGAAYVKQLDVSAAEKDLMLYKNAETLYQA
ncbi:MAG: amidohydrolase family protein [Chloroflexota bacterium]